MHGYSQIRYSGTGLEQYTYDLFDTGIERSSNDTVEEVVVEIQMYCRKPFSHCGDIPSWMTLTQLESTTCKHS